MTRRGANHTFFLFTFYDDEAHIFISAGRTSPTSNNGRFNDVEAAFLDVR